MKKFVSVLMVFFIVLSLSFAVACKDKEEEKGPSVKYYTVIWKNYDETVLETDTNVKSGTKPVYDGVTPVKPEDDNFTYEFIGWDKEVTFIYNDTVYTAVFNGVPKQSEPSEPGGEGLSTGEWDPI